MGFRNSEYLSHSHSISLDRCCNGQNGINLKRETEQTFWLNIPGRWCFLYLGWTWFTSWVHPGRMSRTWFNRDDACASKFSRPGSPDLPGGFQTGRSGQYAWYGRLWQLTFTLVLPTQNFPSRVSLWRISGVPVGYFMWEIKFTPCQYTGTGVILLCLMFSEWNDVIDNRFFFWKVMLFVQEQLDSILRSIHWLQRYIQSYWANGLGWDITAYPWGGVSVGMW